MIDMDFWCDPDVTMDQHNAAVAELAKQNTARIIELEKEETMEA